MAPALVAAWIPFTASAQSVAVPDTPGIPSGSMLQMLLALALIIGLLFAGAVLLRRLNGGKAFGVTGPMRIIGGLMISPRERIVLLEVDETWIVVGIVPGQIKTLHTLPKGNLPPPKDSDSRFGHWLKQMTERTNEND